MNKQQGKGSLDVCDAAGLGSTELLLLAEL